MGDRAHQAQLCRPRFDAGVERIGPRRVDIDQGSAGDVGEEPRRVQGALAVQNERALSVTVDLLVRGDRAAEGQVVLDVLISDRARLDDQVVDGRELERLGLLIGVKVPVGPTLGVAKKIDAGVVGFDQGQDGLALQQRKDFDLHRQAGKGGERRPRRPGRVADDQTVHGGLRRERPGMNLKVAGDVHRPVQPARDHVRQRAAQPVPAKQDQEDDDRQHDRAADHRAHAVDRLAAAGRRLGGVSGQRSSSAGDRPWATTPERSGRLPSGADVRR